MSDRTDKPSEQGPIARFAEVQVVEFISDALRAGQRAILVTGRGQDSMRVPEAALAACASASGRALHIGPPLPEPPELQEMIGTAIEIAGGREMAPEAMAQLLLLADPRPTVILAIDDAHTLPHRTLHYLMQMTELLAPEAPILQIVFAARPTLLDTLAEPEFERLRNRLCRPRFEVFQTLRRGKASGGLSGLRKPAHGRAAPGLAHVRNAHLIAASPRHHGIARAVAYVAIAVIAMSCLAAIGYIAFADFSDGPVASSVCLGPSCASNCDRPDGATDLCGSAELTDVVDGRVDRLIDEVVDATVSDPVKLMPTLFERFAKLEASASPGGLKLMIALPKRLAERASAAAAAGHVEQARRLEEAYRLADSAIGRPELLTASNLRSFRSIPGSSGSAFSAEQQDAAGDVDRAAVLPNAGARAPPGATPDQSVDVALPAISAEAAPPAALSAEPHGEAGNGDRAVSSSNAGTLAPPSAPSDQPVDAALPAILAKAALTAPEGRAALAAPGLPTLAPVRVVLNVARDEVGRARSADIQQALVAAGLEVADLIPFDAQRPGPSIGYYFQSDRNAAVEVSHLLAPLLGAVDPVVLRKRGSIPEPGTIEIAIP